MKFKTIAASLAFATLGSSAFAQAYVGGGVGASHSDLTCSVGTATDLDCKRTGTAGRALVGYAFPGTDFAVEGLYTYLGSFKATAQEGHSDVKVQSWGVGGAWRPQFGGGWGGVVRAGASWSSVKTNFTQTFLGTPISTVSGSDTEGSWHPYLGIGPTYALTPNIRLEASLDFTRVGARSTGNVHTAMLGATFGF